MEQVITNLSGKVRRAKLHGRDYLVAPLTMVVPGVLNGSKGPLYYPPEEIAKSAGQWNGMPIVVYHPLLNGVPASARDPDVLNAQGIGTVLRAVTSQDGKLVAEGWFDVETTRNIDDRIIRALEQGIQLELSTGLFTDNEPAPSGSNYHGVPYEAIARNYRADHLAILPDQVGACSIADGCGVLVNADGKTTVQYCTTYSLEDRLGEVLSTNATKEGLPASAFAYVPDPDSPSTWKLRIDDKTHVAGAVAALDKGFRGNKVSIPAKDRAKVKARVRAAWLKFNPDKSSKDLPSILINEEDSTMDREKVINDLITNSCCWEEEDREVLNDLSDSYLTRLKAQMDKDNQREAVVNAVTKGFTDPGGNTHTWNKEKTMWESKIKEKEEESVQNKGEDKPKEPPKQKTAEEWFKEAPPEVQSAVRNAMTIEKEEKDKIVAELTANLEGESKEKAAKRLQEQTLDALRDLQVLTPPKKGPDNSPVSNFFGQSAPARSAAKESAGDDYLPLPQMDFANQE